MTRHSLFLPANALFILVLCAVLDKKHTETYETGPALKDLTGLQGRQASDDLCDQVGVAPVEVPSDTHFMGVLEVDGVLKCAKKYRL